MLKIIVLLLISPENFNQSLDRFWTKLTDLWTTQLLDECLLKNAKNENPIEKQDQSPLSLQRKKNRTLLIKFEVCSKKSNKPINQDQENEDRDLDKRK